MRLRWRSVAWVAVFVLLTGTMLAGTGSVFLRIGLRDGRPMAAIFTDASGIAVGDQVRAAGVAVGSITGVDRDGADVRVSFKVADDVVVTTATQARIRYADLTGSRYLDLTQPGEASAAEPLGAGATIPLERTRPALDLDTLFAGFDPLMRALDPDELNRLAANVLAVSDGQAGAVRTLLATVGSVTDHLADRDRLIGDTVTHLSEALATVDARSTDLDRLLVGLDRLTSGLARDRRRLADGLAGLEGLARDTDRYVGTVRPDLEADLANVRVVAERLNADSATIARILDLYPSVIQRLGRGAAYGSFFNFFLCSASAQVGIPGAPTIRSPEVRSDLQRCQFPTTEER